VIVGSAVIGTIATIVTRPSRARKGLFVLAWQTGSPRR
jgi:hypothetical protein